MKYSIAWLNELAGTNLAPKEMADLFTRYSFEVDGLSEGVEVPEGVVVGKILEVSKHPNAEKLSLTKVAIDAEGKNILDIVCGAKNIASGDVVPVATVGTTFPNGLIIKESLIRGEKSFGMLCAEDELGLGTDHSGILHLPKESPLGAPVARILKKQDAVIDLSILSSRGHDALCHAGMAREVAAMAGGRENRKKKIENRKGERENEEEKSLEMGSWKLERGEKKDISVTIEAKEKCARYIGVRLATIKNGPSPEWMQERLRTCGMRPINVVVDVTNYVMLETGQPLHAFSMQETRDKREGKIKIFVRNARAGEKMTLLDESEIELREEDLVIANDTEVLALAGVMGGKKSGTDEKTTEVFLEGANFDPMSVRKTRVRHKLSTESAYRFERDIDPNVAEIGVARAVELLKDLAGATVVSGTDVYPEPVLPWTIELDLQRVEKLLGIAVPEEDVAAILESLGMTVQRRMENGEWRTGKENSDSTSDLRFSNSHVPQSVHLALLTVTVPTVRRDLHTQEDLIEEIGRLYGYDRIAPEAPTVSLQSAPTHTEKVFERNFKDALVSAGCDEILTYSFYKKETANIFGFSEATHFSLQNPMNPDQQLFRSSLVPNALEKVKENLRYFDSVRVFEIGNVYTKGTDGAIEGKKMIEVFEAGEDAYIALKGRVEGAFAGVHISGVSFVEATAAPEYFHKTRTANVVCRGKKIGTIGEISPFILEKMKIKKRVALFEAERDTLLGVTNACVTHAPLPKFPFVWRDMSLAVPKSVTAGETENAIRKSVGKTLKSIELFDVYEKEGEKSFAYRLAFGDDARTLTKDEAETLFQKCLQDLEKLGVGLK